MRGLQRPIPQSPRPVYPRAGGSQVAEHRTSYNPLAANGFEAPVPPTLLIPLPVDKARRQSLWRLNGCVVYNAQYLGLVGL